MITLAKHIETLLLDNDCVVVPDFGGFIAHYQSAYYDEKSATFFPPQRIIGFNPKLTMNDGLLVQSYMQSLDTDFSDATLNIEREVDELKEQLFRDGVIYLMNIGRLSCGSDESLFFVPAEKAIETPNLYGLPGFKCSIVSNKKSKLIKLNSSADSLSSEPSSHRALSIGRSFIGSALGVAVALFLFFFLSVPVENSYVDSESYAYLGDAGLFSSIKSKSFVSTIFDLPSDASSVAGKTPMKEKPTVVAKNVVRPAASKATAEPVLNVSEKEEDDLSHEKTIAQSSGPKYHVIISSTSSEEEAQVLIKQLQKKGYNDATIIPGKGYYKYRVSICNLDKESSAYNKLNQLIGIDKTFSDAWVLSSK